MQEAIKTNEERERETSEEREREETMQRD